MNPGSDIRTKRKSKPKVYIRNWNTAQIFYLAGLTLNT
ncbi:Uncharacterized protein dnm_020620 [Desulfonema magnum]|uniref:Uncharacterized protein n=1 Tax=Desulfonema magnum TaxID=45655 RepID=A0A975BHX0_9BACT|nr:Uncharacterized protein dnm_020620 [Desulfonema magnum]